MKRALIDLLTGLAITVGTLCVLEGAASALLYFRDHRNAGASKALIRPHVQHDTLLGWVNRASFSSADEYGKGIGLTTTALGFRGDGGADSAGAGLACSGDSYTLGYGVADDRTWCALVARARGAGHAYNMAEPDYGLDQAALRYRRDGAKAPHALHLLGITNAALERMPLANVSGRPKPTVAAEGGKLVARNVPVPETTLETLRDASRERVKYDLRLVQAYDVMRGEDARARDARRIDGEWSLVDQAVDDVAAVDKGLNSRLVVVYLPTKRDLKPGPLDARRAKLAAHARQRGYELVDLTTAMRAMRPDSLDLAFISRVPRGAAPGVTNQYSNLGNAWIAQHLAEQLGAARHE